MRTVRRVVTLGIGAVAGAATTWLLDPEQGQQRRRQVMRTAVQRARERSSASRATAPRTGTAGGPATAAAAQPATLQAPPRAAVRLGETARELASRAAQAYRDEQLRRGTPLATSSDR